MFVQNKGLEFYARTRRNLIYSKNALISIKRVYKLGFVLVNFFVVYFKRIQTWYLYLKFDEFSIQKRANVEASYLKCKTKHGLFPYIHWQRYFPNIAYDAFTRVTG